jgi:hypothetical protein
MTSKEFVILCARRSLSADQKKLIRKSLADISSWKDILQAARLERVAELLYLNLKAFSNEIPAWVLETLKRQYLFNVKRNLTLLHIIQPLLKSVTDAELKAVVIKGFRLAWDVYRDPGLRNFLDIDFFVSRSERLRFLALMKKLGYEIPGEAMLESIRGRKFPDNLTFRPVFQKGIVKIEVHHSLPGLHLPLLQEDKLWEDTSCSQINGSSVRVLSLEYELCTLCMHAQQHSYSRLMWIADIAEIAAHPQLDWDKVRKICREEKIEDNLFFSLKLVNEFWKESIPQEVLKKISFSSFRIKLMQWLWPRESIRKKYPVKEFPMHAATFFSVMARGNIRLIFHSLKNFLFPPRKWVTYYYKIPKFSWGMARHYIWRVTHPIILLAQHFLKLN